MLGDKTVCFCRKRDNENVRFRCPFFVTKTTRIFVQFRVRYMPKKWFLLQSGGKSTKARESVSGQTFAYLRVSKVEQDLEKNTMDILKLAHEQRLGQVQFVEEKVSGKVSWRKRQRAWARANWMSTGQK